MKVVPTVRDKELFKYLFENKIATRQQITRDIFKDLTRQTVSKRLKKLYDNNYLKIRSVISDKRAKFVYYLTPNGVREIDKEYKYLITGKILKSNSPYHDLNLVDIRFILSQLDLVQNYYTENVLQCCQDFSCTEKYRHFVSVNCDGVLEIKTPKGPFLVALEYDLSDKSASRYRSKLLEYYVSLNVRAVLYICEKKYIFNLLKRVDLDICKENFKPKIFYCLRKNIHHDLKKITFTNIRNDIFTLV